MAPCWPFFFFFFFFFFFSSAFLGCAFDNISHPPPLLADPNDRSVITEETREIGLVVCRGPAVTLVCPLDGFEETENPFIAAQQPVI